MIDREKRIRALSTKRKHVEKLTVEDVVAALAPQERPPAIPRDELRRIANAAIASFNGTITKVPTVDPATQATRLHSKGRTR